MARPSRMHGGQYTSKNNRTLWGVQGGEEKAVKNCIRRDFNELKIDEVSWYSKCRSRALWEKLPKEGIKELNTWLAKTVDLKCRMTHDCAAQRPQLLLATTITLTYIRKRSPVPMPQELPDQHGCAHALETSTQPAPECSHH